MARCLLKATVPDEAGNKISNARCYLYLHGTVTPVSDAWDSETGGTQVTYLDSDAVGDITAWIDTPKRIDIKVTDNTNRAYRVGAVGELLTFADQTKTVDVHEDPSDYAVTANVVTLAGTQTITGAKTFEGITDFDTHVRFKTRPWVDVTHPDFGADPTGVADSYAGVIAALATLSSGGVLFFPAGTYLLSAPINLTSNVTVQGAGIDVTIVRIKAGSNANFGSSFIFQGAGGGTATNVTIKDLTLDGNRRSGGFTSTQGGLLSLGANHWTVEAVKFYDAEFYKIWANAASHFQIKRCRFEDTAGGADTIGGGSDSNYGLIEDCYFTNIAGSAVYFVNVHHLTVRKNHFASKGINLEGARDCVIEDNVVNGGGAIIVSSNSPHSLANLVYPKNNLVRRNHVTAPTDGYGIVLAYGWYASSTSQEAGGGNIITENDVHDCTNTGILSHGSEESAVWKTQGDQITHNVLRNFNLDGSNARNSGYGSFQNSGIVVTHGIGDIVEGNVITDTQAVPTTRFGIALNGAAVGALAVLDRARIVNNTTRGMTLSGIFIASTTRVLSSCLIENNVGYNVEVTSVSANTTLDKSHSVVLVSASGAARTITLPAAATVTGTGYKIKKTDSSTNTVTIDGDASETIDGATTYVIRKQYGWVAIRSDGTNWVIEAQGIGGFTRTDSTTITTTDKVLFGGEIEIDGALNHDGTTVGFYGVTPVTQPTAYTQTYSTADKTHAAPTAATLSMADGVGTNDNTIGAITGDASVIAAFQELVDENNKLVADLADTKQLLNSVIDDLQAMGLVG